MKAPFHHTFTYCLLAASLGLNVWLLHQTPSQQEPDSPPKTTTVLASQLSAEATKREEFQNGPPSGTSNATNAEAVQPHGGTVIKKISEEDFLYGLSPELPEVPKDTITVDRLREIGAQNPTTEKWKVDVRLLLPNGKSVVLGTLDLHKGQRSSLERIKEFPYPSGFELVDYSSGGPMTPTTPTSFVFLNTGMTVNLEVSSDAGTLILGGRFFHRTFVGFGRMPGEAFLPISDGKGTLLTDNRMLLPRFSVGESPFFSAPTFGKPCLVPVQTAAGLAQLELTCTAVAE